MPDTAVPCEPVAQAAVLVPKKTPVPEGWKLAECLVALCRRDAVAVSTTVWMIWTSVTRWMGCTMIVVCMIMITGSAITKQNRRHRISATVPCKEMSFYTRYLPAIPVATAPVGVASAARLPFLRLRLPSPIWPTPGLGSCSGTLAKVWV